MSLASGVAGYVATASAIRLAVVATAIAQGFLLAAVLEHVLAGEGIGAQRDRVVAIGALIVARFALTWAGEPVTEATGAATKELLRGRAFAKVAALGPGHVAGARTGELRATLVEGIESLENYYGRFLPSLVAAVAAPLAVVAVLAPRDAWLALLIAGFAVAAVVLPPLWAGPLEERSEQRMSAYIGLGAQFLDTLQGLVTLKAFGAADRRRDDLRRGSDQLITRWIREMAAALVPLAIYHLAIVGGVATVAAVAAARAANGGLAAGPMFLALFLSVQALRPINVLAAAYHTTYEAGTAADRLHALFATVSPAPVRSTATPAAGLAPSITFDRVTFAYDTRERPVLSDFSLQVDPGRTVAVVGPSGAGKTSVVSLLLRFFDPRQGVVRIGGRDVRDLPSDQLRSMIALVAQDTYLFGGTVAENVAMARPGASRADVETAARVAGAHEFIAALPDGYDSPVGERGLRLSGGQRQRLAIARAVLADAPILVLDEATASVDAAAEASIQSALDQLTAQRTTLIIAHRLSTVRNADQIVVLDDGRVVETGRHDELVTHAGAYARLISAQEVH
ncbi:ABC transporter ATP-binding protein [Frankia sp. CN7]|nr:ABC transporter ATP-binding protein [Frankia nepalensis]